MQHREAVLRLRANSPSFPPCLSQAAPPQRFHPNNLCGASEVGARSRLLLRDSQAAGAGGRWVCCPLPLSGPRRSLPQGTRCRAPDEVPLWGLFSAVEYTSAKVTAPPGGTKPGAPVS